MQRIKREHYRAPVDYSAVVYWEEASGEVSNARPKVRDISEAGMRVECPIRIAPGTGVYVEVPRYGFPIEATVRYCVPEGEGFRIGFEFSAATRQSMQSVATEADYYEVLQLSPKADMETVHRVYRIMAARFHPDNPESGDRERFLLMSEAYRILGDPERRAQYDALRGSERPRPMPLFQARAFVDEKEGEVNRRLGVLCLLYAQRRRNAENPAISLLELEEVMAIPREYLEFTLWYLKQKKYIEMNQGADFSLTATGVDFVEENTPAHAILRKLIGSAPWQEPQEGFAASSVQ
jgi:curved DNA-binding protein CbpA